MIFDYVLKHFKDKARIKVELSPKFYQSQARTWYEPDPKSSARFINLLWRVFREFSLKRESAGRLDLEAWFLGTVSQISQYKLDLHSICFSSVFAVFFKFLLLRKKVCNFSSAFLYVNILTNQIVTYWTKVFQKNFFGKRYSSTLKYRYYRSHTKFLNKIFMNITVYLMRIWPYKNVDEKAHSFSRRSKNVKKRTKTD